MTAVQTTQSQPRRAIGELPPEIQAALELRKQRNLVAAQIAGLSWGEKIDQDTRRAVAAWGQQFRVDVTTEIHVLGGRVYLNAAFYLRRLGEMIAAGLVEYAVADHVEDDPRLKQLGPEGEGEYSRRLRERIRYSIPDAAKSAVVFRVKLRTLTEEVVGVKWTGGGTRKNDPVGEAFPVESAESRAARRCMRLLASHLPPAERDAADVVEQSAAILSDRVTEGRMRVKAQDAELNQPPRPLALPAQNDPYGEPAPVAQSTEPEPEPTQQAAAAEPQRSAAYRYKMPYGGESIKGRPIGELAPEDLDKWYQMLREQGEPDQKARAFMAAYDELQNERDLERGE